MRYDYEYFEEKKLGKAYDLNLLKRLYPFAQPYRLLLGASIVLVVLITLLDLTLPDIDGLDVCRKIRVDHPELPIIMLTARVDDADKIVGLELGADDYLSKPFNPRELLARIESLSRRSRVAPVVKLGAYTIDQEARAIELVGPLLARGVPLAPGQPVLVEEELGGAAAGHQCRRADRDHYVRRNRHPGLAGSHARQRGGIPGDRLVDLTIPPAPRRPPPAHACLRAFRL